MQTVLLIRFFALHALCLLFFHKHIIAKKYAAVYSGFVTKITKAIKLRIFTILLFNDMPTK